MRVAFTNLNGIITDRSIDTIGTFETLSIVKQLKTYIENNNLGSLDILSAGNCSECITVDEDFNINDYDKLIIMNSYLNCFGGAENYKNTIINKIIGAFEGQIYYLLTDLSLPFREYWSIIKNKPWNNYNESDFKLKQSPIIISQFDNDDFIKNIHKIDIKDIKHLDLTRWSIDTYKDINIPIKEKQVDLIYGGAYRAGKRRNKFIDYLFNHTNISTEIYGAMKESQFKFEEGEIDLSKNQPEFTGKVPANKVINKNAESFATIILGDKSYNDQISLRFIEGLLSKTICFIDNDYDSEHKLLKDDYFYVHNGKELEDKILELKNNQELYNRLLNIQENTIKSIMENNTFAQNLYNLIK